MRHFDPFFFLKLGFVPQVGAEGQGADENTKIMKKKSPPSIRLLLNTVGFRFFSSVHSCKMIHVPFSVPENILGEVCKDKGWFFFSCIPLSFAVCAVMRSYLCTAAVFSHPVCCENRDYTRILSGIKWTTDITSLSCGQTSLAVLAYLPATWSVAY